MAVGEHEWTGETGHLVIPIEIKINYLIQTIDTRELFFFFN